MNRTLTPSEIKYVFHHLSHHLKGFKALLPFIRHNKEGEKKPTIIMPLSSGSLSNPPLLLPELDIPLLYPLTDNPRIWTLQKDGTLIFHHDLLKSAFYLLSSRGEWENRERKDIHHRFDYNNSIQKKLNLINKPVVNYYFSLIIEGLMAFSQKQGIPLETGHFLGKGALMLTHDVDRVNYYTWRSTFFRGLQWIGLKPRQTKVKIHRAITWDSLTHMLKPRGKREDPYWSFQFFRSVEKKINFPSTWFFLNRDGSEHDASYSFKEKRIKNLIKDLMHEGCETGLHLSFKASQNIDYLIKGAHCFESSFRFRPKGFRAHFLRGSLPQLFLNAVEAGFEYDAGFGFSAHEGFRNSYCHPFHPFDHQKQEMLYLWVIPMVWMDTTLFDHRNLGFIETQQIIDKLYDEVNKFNGLFNILWHNCRTDEWLQPGIHDFYKNWCESMHAKGAKALTGSEAIRLFSKNEAI